MLPVNFKYGNETGYRGDVYLQESLDGIRRWIQSFPSAKGTPSINGRPSAESEREIVDLGGEMIFSLSLTHILVERKQWFNFKLAFAERSLTASVITIPRGIVQVINAYNLVIIL